MKINFKKSYYIFTVLFILIMTSFNMAYAAPVQKKQPISCTDKINKFKELYLAVQSKANYNDETGKAVEKALYEQYQNSLKKVASLYVSKNELPEISNPNSPLVKFFQAIEDFKKSENANPAIPQDVKINEVIKSLKDASIAKFGAGNKLAISNEDEYLLKSLLVHSNDYICRTGWLLEGNTAKLAQYKVADREQIKKIAKSPLNRMIIALKNVTNDTSLELADTDATVYSAVNEKMNELRDFWNKNLSLECKNLIRNSPGFVQAGIQACNYQKFLNSLANEQAYSDIERILHFINANEEHKSGTKTITPKFLTGLDPDRLESFIAKTFDTNKIRCEVLKNAAGKKEIYIRNLPYDSEKKKYDLSKFVCKDAQQKIISCDNGLIVQLDSEGGLGLTVGITKIVKNKKASVKVAAKNTIKSFSIEGTECVDAKINEDQDQIKEIICTESQVKINNRCEDKANCTDLQEYIVATNKCETKKDNLPIDSCPENQVKINGKCEDIVKCNDKQNYNAETNKCDEKPIEECKPEQLKLNGTCVDKEKCDEKTQELDLTTNTCKAKVVIDQLAEDKKACEALGKVFDPNGEGPAEKCKKKPDDKSPSRRNEPAPEDPFANFLDGLGPETKAPARYVPTQMPTRQIYATPGLP